MMVDREMTVTEGHSGDASSRRLARQTSSRLSQRVIINADDFGYCPEWNRAIVVAFQRKLITSATLMANMPGFEDACGLTQEHGLHGKIGIHLNLTDDRPLTHPIQKCHRICNSDGVFQMRRPRFAFSRSEREAVYAELEAQIQRVLSIGITPTHLDSHHHVHTEWPVGRIVIDLARKYGVPAIRQATTFRPRNRYWKRVYRYPYNARLRWRGLAKTRQCVSLRDIQVALGRSGDIEAVAHPRSNANGNGGVVDLELGEDFERFVRSLDIDDRMTNFKECAE